MSLQTIVQSDCIIRGDLANINVGRQCVIGKRAVITPPFKKLSHGYTVYPPLPGNLVASYEQAIRTSILGSIRQHYLC